MKTGAYRIMRIFLDTALRPCGKLHVVMQNAFTSHSPACNTLNNKLHYG